MQHRQFAGKACDHFTSAAQRPIAVERQRSVERIIDEAVFEALGIAAGVGNEGVCGKVSCRKTRSETHRANGQRIDSGLEVGNAVTVQSAALEQEGIGAQSTAQHVMVTVAVQHVVAVTALDNVIACAADKNVAGFPPAQSIGTVIAKQRVGLS